MNNNNLIPLNQRTKSEQREIAKSGGVASEVARQKKRKIREVESILFDNPPEPFQIVVANERAKRILKNI